MQQMKPTELRFLSSSNTMAIGEYYAKYFPAVEAKGDLAENDKQFGDVTIRFVARKVEGVGSTVLGLAKRHWGKKAYSQSLYLPSKEHCKVEQQESKLDSHSVNDFLAAAANFCDERKSNTDDAGIDDSRTYGISWLATKLLEIIKVQNDKERLELLGKWQTWGHELLQKSKLADPKSKNGEAYAAVLRKAQQVYQVEVNKQDSDKKTQQLKKGFEAFNPQELYQGFDEVLLKLTTNHQLPVGFLTECINFGIAELSYDDYVAKKKKTKGSAFSENFQKVIDEENYYIIKNYLILPRITIPKLISQLEFEFEETISQADGANTVESKSLTELLAFINRPTAEELRLRYSLFNKIKNINHEQMCYHLAEAIQARNRLIVLAYYREQAMKIVIHAGNLAKIFARPQLQSFVKQALTILTEVTRTLENVQHSFTNLLENMPGLGQSYDLNPWVRNFNSIDFSAEFKKNSIAIESVKEIQNSIYDQSPEEDLRELQESMRSMEIGMSLIFGDHSATSNDQTRNLFSQAVQVARYQASLENKKNMKEELESNCAFYSTVGALVAYQPPAYIPEMLDKVTFEYDNLTLQKKCQTLEAEKNRLEKENRACQAENAKLNSEKQKLQHEGRPREQFFVALSGMVKLTESARTFLYAHYQAKSSEYFESSPRETIPQLISDKIEKLDKIANKYIEQSDAWITKVTQQRNSMSFWERLFHGDTGVQRVNNIYKKIWQSEQFINQLKNSFIENIKIQLGVNSEITEEHVNNAFKLTVQQQVLDRIIKHIEAQSSKLACDDLEKQIIGNKDVKLGNKKAYSYKTYQVAFVHSMAKKYEMNASNENSDQQENIIGEMDSKKLAMAYENLSQRKIV